MSVELHVGLRLKARREELSISLRKLAQSTGVTASFLSQVENGKANLSLHSLQSLAEALDVPLLYFLADEPSESPPQPATTMTETAQVPNKQPVFTPLVRSDCRTRWILPDSGVTYELMVPSLGRKMVAICGRLAPGSENVARRLHEPTEEFIYLLSGELLVGLDSGEYRMQAGDSIYFEGDQLHRLMCASTTEEATWISVLTPAVF
jgi:transcriptional regulator with XRE-family HTH domain